MEVQFSTKVALEVEGVGLRVLGLGYRGYGIMGKMETTSSCSGFRGKMRYSLSSLKGVI